MNNQTKWVFEKNDYDRYAKIHDNRPKLILKKKIQEIKMKKKLQEKKLLKKREHDLWKKRKNLKEEKMMKKLEKKKLEAFYYVWEKDIIFNYNVLSYYASSFFSIHDQFPIDVIRYILFILLKYNLQSFKSNVFCPCPKSGCNLNWWKNFPIVNLSYFSVKYDRTHDGWRKPYHCGYQHSLTVYVHYNDMNLSKLPAPVCHTIESIALSSKFPHICFSCKRHFCYNCFNNNKNTIPENFDDYTFFVCNHCIQSYNQGILNLFDYVTVK